MDNKKLIKTLQKIYKREMSGAKTYRELSKREKINRYG